MLRQADRNEPNRKCLWTLQVPISLFSWGAIGDIIELAVLILRPLWEALAGLGMFGFSFPAPCGLPYGSVQASSVALWQLGLGGRDWTSGISI